MDLKAPLRTTLYMRKAMPTNDRLSLYRVLRQDGDLVYVYLNDGRTIGNAAWLTLSEFWEQFEATPHRVSLD